jgi:hypothetical protein
VTRRNGQLLRRASRVKIDEHFTKLSKKWRSTKWINSNNRYRLRCTSRFEKDLKERPIAVNADHLIKYVSASSATHAIDGWSILGRAVESALRGDSYSSIHFGYYAELRAAMALLAAEGIGVFDRQHAVIDANGAVLAFPVNRNPARLATPSKAGTHQMIWPVLNYWSGLGKAGDLINSAVRPNMISMPVWLSTLGLHVPIGAVARQWLSTWGIDLAGAESDHDLRNLASYRPSEFRKPPAIPPSQLINFVEELWQLFEPSTARRFPNLERVLLRQVIGTSHPGPIGTNQLANLGMNTFEAQSWATYLASTKDPLPISLARQTERIEGAECALNVISRAALLLFVATSAVRRMLATAGFTTMDLAFWWHRHGEERTLWDTATTPLDPIDVWQDVLQSITDSKTWCAANPGSSVRAWRAATPVGILSGFDLVAIWGLVP